MPGKKLLKLAWSRDAFFLHQGVYDSGSTTQGETISRAVKHTQQSPLTRSIYNEQGVNFYISY